MQNHTAQTDMPQLVQRAQAGDNAAFDMLIARFHGFAASFALGRVGDPGRAQDAVQDAFLEAWICLPRLQCPAAFPAFLRRILLKQCDRLTRGKRSAASVPLDAIAEQPGDAPELAETAEAHRQKQILADALETLSPLDRTALLLHYADGASQEEVAAFLGLTVATVKSRLHRARHRLREELTQMEETVRELLTSYQNQAHRRASACGPGADAHLLERARRKFDQQMADRAADAPLDPFTVRLGVSLFVQMTDPAATVSLLERYLTQSLSSEEGLWARWHRTNALCQCQRHAETVEAHREMRAFFTNLARTPFLCRYPLFPPEETPFMPPEEISLWILMPLNGLSSVPHSWSAQGSAAEWRAWAEEALAQTPATPENYQVRFDLRQTISGLARRTSDKGLARFFRGKADLMGRFREESYSEGDRRNAARWEIERERALLNQARLAEDATKMQTIGKRIVALVHTLPPQDYLRRVAGSGLILAGLFDLALPIVQPYVESGDADWICRVEYAVCLWKVTGETARSADLFREAQAERRQRNGQPDVGMMPVWRMNHLEAAPEFVAAIR